MAGVGKVSQNMSSLGYFGLSARQPASVAASKSPNWFVREEAEALVEVDGDLAVVSQQERQKNVEQAVAELKAAEELRKDSKPRQAYSHYQLVYLVDMASGYSSGTTSQAVSAMGELKNEQIEKDLKQFPKLKDKVNLIIRDCTLQDAIAQVGRAGKVDLKLAQGALEDAQQLMDTSPASS